MQIAENDWDHDVSYSVKRDLSCNYPSKPSDCSNYTLFSVVSKIFTKKAVISYNWCKLSKINRFKQIFNDTVS